MPTAADNPKSAEIMPFQTGSDTTPLLNARGVEPEPPRINIQNFSSWYYYTIFIQPFPLTYYTKLYDVNC